MPIKTKKKHQPSKSLEKLYKRFFVVLPSVANDRDAESLEQPSPLRVVPTTTHYGVDNEIFRKMVINA
jgi:hypothetical protein